MLTIEQHCIVALPGPEGNMDPRTTAELENTWDDGKASAFVADSSNAALSTTDGGADASVLGNPKADGLVVDEVRSKGKQGGRFSMTRKRLMGSIVVLFMMLASHAAWAQTTGSIRGRIVDPGGLPLPGATIVVTGEFLGAAQRTAVTSASGGFSFPALPIGTFRVTASLDGYQTQAAEEVRVAIGAVATVDFTMPEAFTDEITIVAEAPIIDVASPTFNTRFESEQIIDLPTRGNFYDMIALTPGITQPSEGSGSISAFGADMKNTQWNIDGVNRTLPDGGYLAWSMNDEMVAEIQVLGTGATAEYGNMMGTALNVVTKSGTNQFHGSAAFDYWKPNWVDENAESTEPDTPEEARTYRLDKNNNLAMTLGGPIVRDKVWFFVGAEWGEYLAFGPDTLELPESKKDSWTNYDAKLTAQLGHNHRLTLTVNDHEDLFPSRGSVWSAPSTWQETYGHDNMFALDYSGILGQNTVLEVRGGVWRGEEDQRGQVPTDEPHVADWLVYPEVRTGGPQYTWDWDHSQDTGEIKLTQHADNFIKGDHEFRFGIQYFQGGGDVVNDDLKYYYWYDYYAQWYGPGYEYYYRYVATPFHYGAESETWSAFVADGWRISSDVTLELGVRYDTHKGWVPDYPRLDGDGNPTGEIIPGEDYVDWSNVDPRLGIAWNIGGDGKSVLRASAGLFHAGVVSGDWSYPPPGVPAAWYEKELHSGEWVWWTDVTVAGDADSIFLVPGTENAETWEYTLGFEHQLSATSAIGISAAYKKTTNMLGWYFADDGEFNWETIIDQVTGEEIQLMDYYVAPTRLKGNSTGPGSNGGDRPYGQEYKGVFLTYTKRFSNNWDLMASYSWSESTGLNPRFNTGWTQGYTFWGELQEADPNVYFNAAPDKLLAGDRKHILRLAGNVMLPYQFKLNSVVNIQSGKTYNRSQWYVLPESGGDTIITNPGDDKQRYPTQYLWDFGAGKHFNLGKGVDFSIYLMILNILNDDAITGWQTTTYTEGEDLVPGSWVLPRRAELRLRIAF